MIYRKKVNLADRVPTSERSGTKRLTLADRVPTFDLMTKKKDDISLSIFDVVLLQHWKVGQNGL